MLVLNILSLLTAACLSTCVATDKKSEEPVQNSSWKLNEEYPEPGEEEKFRGFVQSIQALQEKHKKDSRYQRGYHAKHHGCLKARLIPSPTRPLETRAGIFAEGAKEMDAWVRFSNGVGFVQADDEPDVRGMAMKVVGVKGPKLLTTAKDSQSQDFLTTNNPLPLGKNADEFMDFWRAQASGSFRTVAFLGTHWGLAHTVVTRVSRQVPTLLNETYWSGSPYLLGTRASKFNFTPCEKITKEMPKKPSKNYLKEDLAATAKNQRLCFNFNVQWQLDPRREPIEDHSKEWLEENTPSIKIAEIIMEPQIFDTAKQNAFCEAISFNPWHSLPEHRPLGNINRARKSVYEESARLRTSGKKS